MTGNSRRIEELNQKPPREDGRYVLYWMQQSQRAEWNHALEEAAEQSRRRQSPLLVLFTIESRRRDNRRAGNFMLEGLRETEARLRRRRIKMVVRVAADPLAEVIKVAAGASLVVTDAGYLRAHRNRRTRLASKLDCALLQAESDVVVPVALASDKEEYSARTIRPKLQRHWNRDVRRPVRVRPGADAGRLEISGEPLDDPAALLIKAGWSGDRLAGSYFRGGRREALKRLRGFIAERLNGYALKRGDPSLDHVSHMSPYLHFGQISPLEILEAVRAAPAPPADREAYIEELVIRRELAVNYVYYQRYYDEYRGLPAWARATLERHRGDRRPAIYGMDALEQAATADPYWNAAQQQMQFTGKMHNYMRMYWGKKLLEWHQRPEDAFSSALALNNRYEIDGRDPSSFAGVAWCFGKHDRPWKEREVFGTVRYMNDRGLRRKFRIDDYVRQVSELEN